MKTYFADFETNNNGNGKVVCGAAVETPSNLGHGQDIDSFYNGLLKLEHGDVVYFHNLSFDGNYLVKYFTKIGLEQRVNRLFMSRGKGTFEITGDVNDLFQIILSLNGTNIYIKCSYRLFNMSVKELSKYNHIYKTKNSELINDDYSNLEYSDDLLQYCINDCCVVGEYFYANIANKYKQDDTPLTSGSMAKRIFDEMCTIQEKKNLKITYKEYQRLENYVQGGLTTYNFNKAQKRLTDIRCFDVNSYYPSMLMKHGAIGGIYEKSTFSKHTYPPQEKDNYGHFVQYKISYGKNKPKGEGIVLYKKGSDFYNFNGTISGDTLDGYGIQEEGDQLNKMCIIKAELVDEFYIKREVTPAMRKYISHYFEIKCNTNDKVIRNTAKLMLNSLSGKFAQKIKDEVCVLSNNTKIPKHFKLDREMMQEIYDGENIIHPKIYINTRASKEHLAYLPIYIVMTAMCRVELLKKIEYLEQDFVYADTDSIKYIETENSVDVLNGQIDDSKLGFWKDEGGCDKFMIFGNKQYIYEQDGKKEIKICGLSKKYIVTHNVDELWDKLENLEIIKGGKMIDKKTLNGIVFDDLDFQLHIKKLPKIFYTSGDLEQV